MTEYLMRRGLSEDFKESILTAGEVTEITDKNTLAFCFGEGNILYLKVDEEVDRETALELIFQIKRFIENSCEVAKQRTSK